MHKNTILTSSAPNPIGPYSQAIMTGNLLFVSGQIAINPADGSLICDNIVAETNQVMLNLQAILKEANMDFSNVIKCSIFIKNIDDFADINTAYGKYFPENPPARETVEVSRLPKDVNVEISCVAAG